LFPATGKICEGENAMKKMYRRHFLKTSGKLTLAGATALCIEPMLSCLLANPLGVAFASNPQAEFNVYNGVNPNAKDILAYTFKDCLAKKWWPGICYKTPKPMVAVASGTVTDTLKIGDLGSGGGHPWMALVKEQNQAKGFLVKITHGSNYTSYYLHLGPPKVKFGQKMKRGQIIGYPDARWNMPRLVFKSGEAIDPNNFGIDHCFMTYWDGATDLEIGKNEQNKRVDTQQKLLYKIAEMVEGPQKFTLLDKSHKGSFQYGWSMIEKFRYIEHKYQHEPETFPTLTKELFEKMKKEFYSNQAIILTLPFEKG